jgi:DNA-binding MarR family transcriptional regulator/GNAT superfamily N-acetyltransferase
MARNETYAPATRTVDAVRRFNRFYTKTLGILPEGHLHTTFSLAEVRVLYEIAHRDAPTARAIGSDLALDAGYLSRMIRRLEGADLIKRARSSSDRRESFLSLTPRGRSTFASLDRSARADVASVLESLDALGQRRLTAAMSSIQQLLSPAPDPQQEVVLRAPSAGDLGWVVERHGAIYGEEYGWNAEFEGLVAKIVGDFALHFDPKRERCWIAERAGERLGSIFLVRKSARVAKLRLLLVEPHARGFGIGRRLVDACILFAREAGYKKITLWTQSILKEAHRIYVRAGFTLVERKPHKSFGASLVGETWELEL